MIIENFIYLINLTFTTDVLWLVFQLFIATLLMVIYFEKYRDERPGWNTHFANSLVLLFVSISLFRYLYGLSHGGLMEVDFIFAKFIASSLLILMGIVILTLNFEHFLPEKIASHISSPLTINILAYIFVLIVYSEVNLDIYYFVSLFFLFISLILVFNLIRLPLRKLFIYLKKMKEKEEIEEIHLEKKVLRKKKQELKKEEKEVIRERLKRIEEKKKMARRLRKHLRE